jgi:hypothetical protein
LEIQPRGCQFYTPLSLNSLSCTDRPTLFESGHGVSAIKKILILQPLKANIMQLQKAFIYIIIFIIFLLGVYEIKSGNVRDFAFYKNSTEPIYIVVPGDWLIFGAIGLFIIISHTFSKIKN